MKKGIIISIIIIGSILLSAGVIMFAKGLSNNNKTNGYEINEHVVESFSNINIDIATADLEFKESEDGITKVVCREKEKVYHTVEVKDDTLYVKSFDNRKWYEKIFDLSLISFKVTIYTTTKDFSQATLKSSTGDINIPNDYTFDNLNVEVSTGDVEINSNVKETLNINSSTGSIKLNLNAKKINIESSTGSQTLRDVTSEEIKIKSSTGDIKFIDCDATTSIDIKTSTGDVTLTLLSGKTFEAETSTGKHNVPTSLVGAPLCKIETSTGDIKVEVK